MSQLIDQIIRNEFKMEKTANPRPIEYVKSQNPVSANKYHSKKVFVNGEKFDSRKEYNRWRELKLLERAGEIKDLKRQVKYRLIQSQHGDGRNERPVDYIADFTYYDSSGLVVEDTKGVRTKDYIIKRKLMLLVHGITIKEV